MSEPFHTLEIKKGAHHSDVAPGSAQGCLILLDGVPLKGVTGIQIEMGVDRITQIKLTMWVDFVGELEGQLDVRDVE